MSSNKILFLIILLLLIFINGCYVVPSETVNIIRKQLSKKNPTIYIFDKPLYEVKSVIEKAQYSFGLNLDLCKKGDTYLPDELFLYDGIFDDTSNFNDYILVYEPGGICKSQIYFSEADSSALDYYASFHLHLTKIDSNRTMVQVITYKSAVRNGNKTIVIIGMDPQTNLEPVEATSVEEYQILLKIGESLGIKEKMPNLILP